jgi:hypothetical protein
MELSDSVNNSWDPNYSIWHFGKHFRLMQDINNVTQSIGWTYFCGHFHGGGNKITLAIDIITLYSGPCLFATIYNGSVDSLIVDGYINGIGGIVGSIAIFNFNSTINQCTSNVIIINPSIYGYGVGGIVGTNDGTIVNCINNGSIIGDDRIGGIAGENEGTIINCINTGKITATNSGESSIFSGVGGIVGTSANGCLSISNCTNIGIVEGQGFVGGIIGLANWNLGLSTQINKCVNNGLVFGLNGVGGIIGNMFNSSVTISNCINTGVVLGGSNTGSIVGKMP